VQDWGHRPNLVTTNTKPQRVIQQIKNKVVQERESILNYRYHMQSSEPTFGGKLNYNKRGAEI
jgi:hypothetical protein